MLRWLWSLIPAHVAEFSRLYQFDGVQIHRTSSRCNGRASYNINVRIPESTQCVFWMSLSRFPYFPVPLSMFIWLYLVLRITLLFWYHAHLLSIEQKPSEIRNSKKKQRRRKLLASFVFTRRMSVLWGFKWVLVLLQSEGLWRSVCICSASYVRLSNVVDTIRLSCVVDVCLKFGVRKNCDVGVQALRCGAVFINTWFLFWQSFRNRRDCTQASGLQTNSVDGL